MRARPLKLLASCLLLLAVLQPRPHPVPPPVISPSASPQFDWSVLRERLDARALWIWNANQKPATKPPSTRIQRPQQVYGSGACGGDLPSCSVLKCESGGNLVAQNPGSTASGKWQILDSTWAGYGGFARAMYAPEDVQDAKARLIYRNGAGRSAWVC